MTSNFHQMLHAVKYIRRHRFNTDYDSSRDENFCKLKTKTPQISNLNLCYLRLFYNLRDVYDGNKYHLIHMILASDIKICMCILCGLGYLYID